MIHDSNLLLEKYEIKKPDYDLIHRDKIGMEDAVFHPQRYTFRDGQWFQNTPHAQRMKANTARLLFLGDITCFEKQFDEAQTQDGYDFSYQLAQVKSIFAQADLVVGNLETMIFPNAPYRSEKYVSEQNFHCNAPIEFLYALRLAGIDMLTNANNHDLDTGAIGIGETIDHVQNMGFIHTGTFKTTKPRFEIIHVGEFKIAVTAFATEHNNKRCNLTREGAAFLLNDYTPEHAADVLAQARKAGADLVFTCIHWGKENKLVQNKDQEAVAQQLADMGYDCIIGSHPHVLQPFALLNSGKRTVPVFYSMGNFLSHNISTPKSRSIIACVDAVCKNGKLSLECSYIPIHTSKNYGDKKYVVLPIGNSAVDPRNITKKNQIKKIMGAEIRTCTSINITERVERLETNAPSKKSDPPADMSTVSVFPVTHDDGKFIYSLYRSSANVTGLSQDATMSSYSIPAKIGELPITGLRVGAMRGNQIMKKLNFGSNIQSVNEEAFQNCTVLEGFQLSRKTTEIRDRAFAGCINLSAAVMRKKVKRIGSQAFAGCEKLRSVKIPANVTEIADDAFEGCTNAVFYCEAGSYGESYAKAHGFTVVRMELSD